MVGLTILIGVIVLAVAFGAYCTALAIAATKVGREMEEEYYYGDLRRSLQDQYARDGKDVSE